MASSVYEKLGGAFAFMTAPFGVHPKDRERAEPYRDAAIAAGLQWNNIEADIREYLATHRATSDFVEDQVGRAKKFFKA